MTHDGLLNEELLLDLVGPTLAAGSYKIVR